MLSSDSTIVPRYITEEELASVTKDDIIYKAAAEIAIRKGYWVVVNNNGVPVA